MPSCVARKDFVNPVTTSTHDPTTDELHLNPAVSLELGQLLHIAMLMKHQQWVQSTALLRQNPSLQITPAKRDLRPVPWYKNVNSESRPYSSVVSTFFSAVLNCGIGPDYLATMVATSFCLASAVFESGGMLPCPLIWGPVHLRATRPPRTHDAADADYLLGSFWLPSITRVRLQLPDRRAFLASTHRKRWQPRPLKRPQQPSPSSPYAY
ncbi:hypothetical protein HDK77DRAFT_82654 [Phyllosticta capitalensis]|uniref:Uncharacterized protein n=1 Tax=Phyllosticta capitalensis TaxID=121624 RepID=A0ABR1YD31_9PEZI